MAFGVDRPGWNRGAKSVELALEMLESYRERYRPVARLACQAFPPERCAPKSKAERIRLSYAVSAADSKAGSAYSAVLWAPRLASLACVASACRCNPIALNRASASARRSLSLRAIPRARAANGAT